MTNKRGKIILVDDNMADLYIGKSMLKAFHEIYTVPSAKKLFECLERFIPDLILLDIEMPDMDGYETIKRLKNTGDFADIPVIFLTGKSDDGSELEGLGLGAADYVAKPFSAPLLLKRLESQLLLASQKKALKRNNEDLRAAVLQKTRQVTGLQNSVLNIVAELVEFRDSVTGGHVFRTQKYLQFLIEQLVKENVYAEEVSGWDLDLVVSSAQLHDVGKIAISDAILNKPGKLTDEEFEKMKTHVAIGVDAINRIEATTAEHTFLHHAKIIAGAHHEKWDGSGYPLGLSGMCIPLEGRLMAIADVYDALISERPYKKAFTAAEAEAIIEKGRGAHFDPALVDIFHPAARRFTEIVDRYREEFHQGRAPRRGVAV
jgi:putative two-component system response regulator